MSIPGSSVIIEGHAIVSVDGMIAAADGTMPPALRSEPDWRIFQAALDVAADPKLSSPESQPDLLVSTAVASAMYDSIYGVIEDQLTPEKAVELVQKAIEADQAG